MLDDQETIPFPTFDHSLKDPHPSPTPILPTHRIVIVEGLYTLLDISGWSDCAELFDFRVYVDTEKEVCRERVVNRNFAAGIMDDMDKLRDRGERKGNELHLTTVENVDMFNGELIRSHLYDPTDVIRGD